MTPEHLIFIPTVFLLGLMSGLLLNARRSGALPVLLLLGLALGTFSLTHLTELPIGAGAVRSAIGGAPLFDQSPSFSASEVFERIERFGEVGRTAYRLETYSGDVLFPLTLLAFLLTLARFSAGRLLHRKWTGRLNALPLAWFSADMVENFTIYSLLTGHPSPSAILAQLLGPITAIKLILLAASILGPLLVLGAAQFGKRSGNSARKVLSGEYS